jgi:hypothetical protein
VTVRRLTIIATGPSGPPDELDPLRAAGHEVVIGRPLDTPAEATIGLLLMLLKRVSPSRSSRSWPWAVARRPPT